MNNKLSKALALAAVLACTSLAMAQETTGTSIFGFTLPNFGTSLASLATAIGPIAGIILFFLFARFGGFRWLY